MQDKEFGQQEKVIEQTKKAWENVKDDEEAPEEIKAAAKKNWLDALKVLQDKLADSFIFNPVDMCTDQSFFL